MNIAITSVSAAAKALTATGMFRLLSAGEKIQVQDSSTGYSHGTMTADQVISFANDRAEVTAWA